MKRLWILFITAVIVYGPAIAQPQQSENFRMTKSVLDGGGGASSSTNFQLVSAFGQPTPVGMQSSANFVLYAGFLEPSFQISPISPIQHLVILREGTDMRLWWEPITGAESYRIYRDPDPLFTPAPGNQVGSVTDTTFADTGVVGLPPLKYYYVVTAVNLHDDSVAKQGTDIKQKNVSHKE